MKCKCGNPIDVRIAAKVAGKGCKLLTAFTIVATIQCDKCGAIMQVPIQNDGVVFN